jgi:AcrR family transcriptional regulator
MIADPLRRTQAERLELSGRLLLAAAAELIGEKGWEATTAAEIGRRAGYSRAMVHARFGSKEALLNTLFSVEYEQRLNPPADQATTGLQRLLAPFDRIEALFDEDPGFLESMFALSFEAVKRGSVLRPRITAWLEQVAGTFEDNVRAGIADGSVRPDVHIADAASDVLARGVGIAYGWIVLPQRYDLRAELDRTRALIIRSYGQ